VRTGWIVWIVGVYSSCRFDIDRIDNVGLGSGDSW